MYHLPSNPGRMHTFRLAYTLWPKFGICLYAFDVQDWFTVCRESANNILNFIHKHMSLHLIVIGMRVIQAKATIQILFQAEMFVFNDNIVHAGMIPVTKWALDF